MPRTGGEADKLGNRYEGIWTVNALLDVIAGEFATIVVEPIGEEGGGFEFRRSRTDGVHEVHSVKRQVSEGHWTLANLARTRAPNRSVLGDLIALTRDDTSSIFVSGVAAQGLHELCEAARSCASLDDFERLLAQRGRLSGEFVQRVVPITGSNREAAFHALQRVSVHTIGEPDLIRQGELRVRSMFRMTSGEPLDSRMTRLLLGDIVTEKLGQELTAQSVLAELARHGVALSRLEGAADVRARLNSITGVYLNNVRRTLINQTDIERAEAATAHQSLSDGRSVLLEAPAGLGKSCVVVQAIERLRESRVPCLVLRADTLQSGEASTQAWGRGSGLPDSPVVSLGEFAGNTPSVLCIDQLDAVSVVSARNPTAWAFMEELLYEVQRYPNMRLLIACRSFDLEHDPRLHSLVEDPKRFHRITIEPLAHEAVKVAVEVAGQDPSRLTGRQLDVLATPLHLYLFLHTLGESTSFTSRGELFDRYWNAKERAVDGRSGRSGGWVRAIGALCDALSERQSLEAPEFVLDDHSDVRAALQSESVVLTDSGRCRFFHESFFDYAFARSFLRQRRNLVEWLAADEQPLFRRSQVRQVLEFLRNREADRARYLQALEGVLHNERIRFHIKKLILDWLGRAQSPMAEEWHVLERFVAELGDHVWSVIRNSTPWFDVLHALGLWDTWLRLADDAEVNRTIWLLGMPSILAERSEIVAQLLRSFRGRSDEWNNRLTSIVRRGDVYHSPEMEQLVLDLIADGTLDDLRPGFAVNDDWWSTFYVASTAAPSFTVRVLAAWWDRQIARAHALGRLDPFQGDPELVPRSQFSAHVVRECSARSPLEFAREMFPRVAGFDGDVPQLLHATPLDIGGPDEQIRTRAVAGLSTMAREQPDDLDALVEQYTANPTDWVAATLLSAWSANPERYAEQIASFILNYPEHRLDIGYSFAIGDTDMLAAISRTAIAAAGPYCSNASFHSLEEVILDFTTDRERRIRATGRTQLALLRALPFERTSERARRRIQELERRFPDAQERGAPRPPEDDDRAAHWVGPPIPPTAQALMSDDHWLVAMEEYTSDRSEIRDGHFVGGAIELSRGLENLLPTDTERFAALVERMHAGINPVYFEAILRGLAPMSNGRTLVGTPVQVWRVIRLIKELGVAVRGEEVARAAAATVEEDVPSDIIDILCRIAIEDPDPETDEWLHQDHGDALTQAINSARGEAAEAISRLLFASRARWPHLRPTVERLVVDHVLAVRAAAADCLLAILDSDREDALALFSTLADGAEPILDSGPVERFIHYAIFRQYAAVRPLLMQMLASDRLTCVRSGARHITLAALWHEELENDLSVVIESGEHARAGAAEIFAANVAHADVTEQCETYLRASFLDESAEVRRAASDCWRSLSPDEIAARGSLIEAFAESPAFGDGEHTLFYRLREARRLLPSELCLLAERAVEAFGDRASSIQFREAGDATELADLMIRLHEETSDPNVRTRILNAIDRMMRAGFYGLDEKIDARFTR